MDLLSPKVKAYPWGTRDAIADLQGRPTPTPGPEAELWMGAHPDSPSVAGGTPLTALIGADPVGVLGAATVDRFGPRLPLLMKVLAAGEPLSLQAHPTMEQAQA